MTTEKKKNRITTCIPLDLIIEILLKLPATSVLRFRLVSKSWYSIIRSKQFIDEFMSLSLSRPRLVLAFSDWGGDRVLFFSSSPHQSCSCLSSSSLSVAEKNIFTMPDLKPYLPFICGYVRGFICCGFEGSRYVVCNPCTGQIIHLTKKNSDDFCCMYLGYDPNSDQYKVLRLTSLGSYPDLHIEYSVLTLEDQGSSQLWRPIKTSIIKNYWYRNGVCIDGIVYYKCRIKHHIKQTLCSFDVGSEQILDIDTPQEMKLLGDLTNYIGKLAVHRSIHNSFDLWVLDDVKNQVWSKKTYEFPLLNELKMYPIFRAVITTSGEIVYVPPWFTDSFELVCYDKEKKMGRSVKVTGLSDSIYDADKCTTPTCGPFYSTLLCSYVDNIIYL